MSASRIIRGVGLVFATAIILLVLSPPICAQPLTPVKQFKVKDNVMRITLSRALSPESVDSFIQKYNVRDIGLGRFYRSGKDDSLELLGWTIDVSHPQLYIITKPLQSPDNLLTDGGKIIFSPVHTPDDWREVGGNRVIYGVNEFRNDTGFSRKKDIVYFHLKGYRSAKRVRLAGNFTNWQHAAFPMTQMGDGWTVPVKLKPGQYFYKFIVNNDDWLTDPENELSENDGRGNVNSVYFVTNKTFELKGYHDAKKVFISGSFNNWVKETKRLKLQRTPVGWRISLYLEPGTHTFQFIVDGKILQRDKPDKSMLAIGKPHNFILKGYRGAKRVILAGNFNDWREDELIMERTEEGWKLSYVLGPGNYQYKFIVDGSWITDPQNPSIIDDGEGNLNSFLVIAPNYNFRLKGFASAKAIYLAGDFNNWSPAGLPMKRVGDEWICAVYLARGKHLYKFIIDGKWILDPANKSWEENEFGTGNSVIWIEDEGV